MGKGNDRIALLAACGLNESQARTYLALVDHSELTASALAKVARLPRNRVYETLQQLHEKDLVEIHLGARRRFRARPASTYLDALRRRLRSQIEDLEERIPAIEEAIQPPRRADTTPSEEGAFRVLSGRSVIAREIERLVERARSSLYIVSTPRGHRRVLEHVAPVLAQHHPTGKPHLRVVLPVSAASDPASRIQRGAVPWLDWTSAEPATISMLVDHETVLAVQPLPDDGKLRSGNDTALLTTNPGIIRDYRLFLENLPLVTAPGALAGRSEQHTVAAGRS